MKCPVCETVDLRISERQGVEIDYCPQCRGVWLDRGELDKIIERAAQVETSFRAAPVPPAGDAPKRKRDMLARDEYYYDDDDDDDRRRYGDERYKDDDDRYRKPGHPKHRKRGFLDDIFDIFD